MTSVSTTSLCRCNTPRNAASRQHFTFFDSAWLLSLFLISHHIIFPFPLPLSSPPLSLLSKSAVMQGRSSAVKCSFTSHRSTGRPKDTQTAECIYLLWHHRLRCGQRTNLLDGETHNFIMLVCVSSYHRMEGLKVTMRWGFSIRSVSNKTFNWDCCGGFFLWTVAMLQSVLLTLPLTNTSRQEKKPGAKNKARNKQTNKKVKNVKVDCFHITTLRKYCIQISLHSAAQCWITLSCSWRLMKTKHLLHLVECQDSPYNNKRDSSRNIVTWGGQRVPN